LFPYAGLTGPFDQAAYLAVQMALGRSPGYPKIAQFNFPAGLFCNF